MAGHFRVRPNWGHSNMKTIRSHFRVDDSLESKVTTIRACFQKLPIESTRIKYHTIDPFHSNFARIESNRKTIRKGTILLIGDAGSRTLKNTDKKITYQIFETIKKIHITYRLRQTH